MTKREFMAMCLPYGLKVSTIKSVEYVKKFCLYDTRYFRLEFEISENSNDFRKSYPILYPLSDLTKEIEHNGEKFVPEENLLDSEMILRNADYRMLRFGDIERLISWHFDLFGGIDSGDAIDVNSLHENPYK